jgi:outer membrane immunogenic protein
MRGFALALAGAISLGVTVGPASAQETAKTKDTKPLVTKAPAKTAAGKARTARAQDLGGNYSWTGFYGGMTTGHLWGQSSWANVLAPATMMNQTFAQGMLGGHLGAQVHVRNSGAVGWVLGTEFSYSGAPGQSGNLSSQPCLFDATQGCRTRMNNLLTAGGRLGLAYESFLLYGGGGYAQARVRTDQLLAGDVCNGTLCDSTRARGWYAGAGLEYKVLKIDVVDLILGLEWQHIRLDTTHLAGGGITANTRDVDVSADVVRARLTVKYNPFGNGTTDGDYKIDW